MTETTLSKYTNRGNLKHGHSSRKGQTKTYISWQAMRRRCYNPNSDRFQYYGGRGIGVCEEWRNSFEAFLRDMGESPVGYTLERIDNSRNYEPGNCRWATRKEQANNRRSSHMLELNGTSKTMAQWADQYGIDVRLLWARIYKCGWSVDRAITEPKRPGLGLKFR